MNLARGISNIEKWSKYSCFDCLPIQTLSDWMPNAQDENDNDYSAFKIVNFVKDEDSNKIVLRLLAENFRKWFANIDLLILIEDFNKNFTIVPDCKEKYDTLHVNIKNVTYREFQKLFEYTYNNRDKVIKYNADDIKMLFETIDENQFYEYIESFPQTINGKFISKIRKVYFKESNSSINLEKWYNRHFNK